MYVDKRLAGIQAVQTLSRLNRAHPGKDTTYVLDFVNSAEEILAAFKTYYETAELEASPTRTSSSTCGRSSTPRAIYDDFEVDRVAAVEMDPKAKQGDLVAAIEPGRRPTDEAVQGGAAAAEAARERATRRQREAGAGRARRPCPVQGRHGRVPADLQLPLSDLRLWQHGHREAVHLLSGVCCRCWISGASVRASICPRSS